MLLMSMGVGTNCSGGCGHWCIQKQIQYCPAGLRQGRRMPKSVGSTLENRTSMGISSSNGFG